MWGTYWTQVGDTIGMSMASQLLQSISHNVNDGECHWTEVHMKSMADLWTCFEAQVPDLTVGVPINALLQVDQWCPPNQLQHPLCYPLGA